MNEWPARTWPDVPTHQRLAFRRLCVGLFVVGSVVLGMLLVTEYAALGAELPALVFVDALGTITAGAWTLLVYRAVVTLSEPSE